VVAVARASPSFHPQWSAAGKEYRYRFKPSSAADDWDPFAWSVLGDKRLWGKTLDVDALQWLLQQAVGTRDFIAFHEKSSPRKLRTLTRVEFARPSADLLELRFHGSGFGRHQIRFLTGSAVLCASGHLPKEGFLDAIHEGTPIQGIRAPARGLILWEVLYPRALDPFPLELRACPEEMPSEPPFVA
jgi:tRNA pseudouridine38-40 synthase